MALQSGLAPGHMLASVCKHSIDASLRGDVLGDAQVPTMQHPAKAAARCAGPLFDRAGGWIGHKDGRHRTHLQLQGWHDAGQRRCRRCALPTPCSAAAYGASLMHTWTLALLTLSSAHLLTAVHTIGSCRPATNRLSINFTLHLGHCMLALHGSSPCITLTGACWRLQAQRLSVLCVPHVAAVAWSCCSAQQGVSLCSTYP